MLSTFTRAVARRLSTAVLVLAVVGIARADEFQQPGGSVVGPVEGTDVADELALEDEEDEEDILDMDLDQLANTEVTRSNAIAGATLSEEVTSVSRSAQSVARTASAVYVISQEKIRRSGARNLMEALRLAPGVHVARVAASSWAIGIRGFNGVYSDKLLVQIDGRAVYTPIFAGTFWELQLVPLHDVERIEVIRGPGATVWGANAVNGVINIITKDSRDTVGAYAETGGGGEHRSFSHGRVGGYLGDRATYRVYGMHVEDDPGLSIGPPIGDQRRAGQGGFRVDWTPTCNDQLTAQGDFLDGESFGGLPGQVSLSSGNFLTRWTHRVDQQTEWMVQSYYDHFKRNYDPSSLVVEQIGQNVFDVDTQAQTTYGWHEVVAGVGFRSYATYLNSRPGQAIDAVPDRSSFETISYFLQDTVTLSEDQLFFTLGCKFEHNDFVGFVYQPSAKLALTPDPRTSLWASVSRAVRTPSVANRDISLLAPLGGGAFLNALGSRGSSEEEALTYEVGCRRQPTDAFYWEVAAFYTRYAALNRLELVDATPPMLVGGNDNTGDASTYGFELWGNYDVMDCWRLRASYSFFREDIDFNVPASVDVWNNTGTYPRNMAYLGSSTDLTRQVTFDLGFRYVDALRIGQGPTPVDAYLEMDARVAWALDNGVEVAIVGQNLLDSSHREFVEPSGLVDSSEVQRGLFGVVSWEY